MSHEHRREGDQEPPTKAELVDGAYKVGKILVMLFVGGGFLLTIRDRIEAIPVLQKDVVDLKMKSSEAERQLAYLVGGMEALTGRKYRPRRESSSGE